MKKKDKKKAPKRFMHQAFCDLYLTTWNATEAYMKTHPRSSREAAWRSGSDLLRNAEVAAYISERIKTMTMGADETLIRIADQARGSFKPFVKVDSDGVVFFDFSKPEAMEYIHLIKKISTKESTRYEGKGADREPVIERWTQVELHDAQKALELIGKHHKLFTDQMNVSHSLNVEGLDAMLELVYGTDNASG